MRSLPLPFVVIEARIRPLLMIVALMSPEQLVARLEHDLSAWDGLDGALIFAIERGWEALEPALRATRWPEPRTPKQRIAGEAAHDLDEDL